MSDQRLRWLRGRSGFWAALLAITICGALLRVIASRESLAFDELYLYSWVHGRSFTGMLEVVGENEKTPPLGFILAWLADQSGGPPQLIRIPSLLAAIGLLPATAMLGRRAANSAAGLIGALLLAASPFALFYAAEARSYSLAALFGVLAVLLLLKALDAHRARWWVLYSLASAAALMSHYTAIAVLAAAAIWALIARRDGWRQVAAAQLGPLIALLAWLPWLGTQIGNSSDELHRIAAGAPLSLETLVRISERSLIGHPLTDLARIPGQLATVAIAVGVLSAACYSAISAIRRRQRGELGRPTDLTLLLFAVAASAPLLAVLLSLQPGQSMLLPRNLFVSLPAVMLLVGILIQRCPRPLAIASTLLIVVGLAAGSVEELRSVNRPATAEAAAAVNSAWRAGDRVIDLCCLNGADGPLGSELRINLDPAPARSLSLVTVDGAEAYTRALRSRSRVFIIGYRVHGSNQILFDTPPPSFEAAYRPVWAKSWPGLLSTVLREYRPIEQPRR
ncbi:MAG: glycosyltransferase family 39 protein [Solirubrobacterales bacterium]|nr:glycosyltransferase family 39 protein [Solirubrobacterales bacterium]